MKAVKNKNILHLSKLPLLVICFLFGAICLPAQVELSVNKESILPIPELTIHQPLSGEPISVYNNPGARETPLVHLSKQPRIYSYSHLAFFCKIEVQLEKATKFPVKFRLGDVQYVDQLEGKGNNW